MKKSKLIKRALLTSILTLFMSVTCLIGTSFAWFTDTASVSIEKIEAGNLDITVEAKNPNYDENVEGSKQWVDAENKTIEWAKSDGAAIQDQANILWEPGSTYKLQELRISNSGDLALKYKIAISGINTDTKSNNVIELNDAITWTIKLGEDIYNPDTEYKLKADESNILSISGTMDENASSDYQGLSIDNIVITIAATQDTVEYDSNNNEYDKDSEYETYVGKKISTSESYIGKYADIDGDGAVDGVIFADLAFSKSGEWGNAHGFGTYSYSATSNLKEYYVSKTATDDFGEQEVISLVSETTGNDRFYVMALDNADSSTHSWYYSALISDTNITSEDFGTGKQNTAKMAPAWNGAKYGDRNKGSSTDAWSMISVSMPMGEYKVATNWFIPSRAEWTAFGNALGITNSNYTSYGLSDKYWSSSLNSSNNGAYYAYFGVGAMASSTFTNYYHVRLAITF